MQAEIDTVHTAKRVSLNGINATGLESGNPDICAGRSLPWLQDTPQANVWMSWRVNFRDCIVLNAQNEVILTYNLTEHDLSVPANYAALKSALIDAAGPVTRPW